ncbi:MAG: hypothetical protein COT73_00095, partial [Bdellovibrio sp. CG10_big_fil_rev_8_21_14_0_10_47_8]
MAYIESMQNHPIKPFSSRSCPVGVALILAVALSSACSRSNMSAKVTDSELKDARIEVGADSVGGAEKPNQEAKTISPTVTDSSSAPGSSGTQAPSATSPTVAPTPESQSQPKPAPVKPEQVTVLVPVAPTPNPESEAAPAAPKKDFDPADLVPGSKTADFVSGGMVVPTIYFLATHLEDDDTCDDDKKVSLLGTDGSELMKVCPETLKSCSMEGSCRISQ